mmetsp:Transcript_25556/g.64963  ORF Transcript_25556/g.64963 Transcript_25556/m.64963 type:complete len:94 (-) Transcript_25556:60-341(-)
MSGTDYLSFARARLHEEVQSGRFDDTCSEVWQSAHGMHENQSTGTAMLRVETHTHHLNGVWTIQSCCRIMCDGSGQVRVISICSGLITNGAML